MSLVSEKRISWKGYKDFVEISHAMFAFYYKRADFLIIVWAYANTSCTETINFCNF